MNALASRNAALDLSCGGLLPVFADETRPAVCEAIGGAIAARVSRAELRARVEILARRLFTGDKRLILLLATNSIAGVTALLAARAAGHAVALIDPMIAADRWSTLLAAYSPDFILSREGPTQGVATAPVEWRKESLGGVGIARQPASSTALRGGADLLLSTSGTTGSAKFVRLGAAAIAANAAQIAEVLRITPDDVAAAHLPIHYSYGLSVLTSHLVAGAAVTLVDDGVTTPTFWKSLAVAGVTHFPGVPFHYQVLSRLGVKRLAPKSIRTFTQAGGALDLGIQKAMHAQAAEQGAGFYVMYGQTEAAPRITTLDSADFPRRVGSVGRALPGGKLTVLDDAGAEQAPSLSGDVIYEGPNVMLGYAEGRADLDLGDDLGGRLVTGDLGYLDGQGFLFLTGRAKRFAKVYGLRISLDEVERRVGRPCAAMDRGEQIVLLHDDGDAGSNELKMIISEIAAEYRLPTAAFEVRALDAIPRKDSGKIDYAAIRELL